MLQQNRVPWVPLDQSPNLYGVLARPGKPPQDREDYLDLLAERVQGLLEESNRRIGQEETTALILDRAVSSLVLSEDRDQWGREMAEQLLLDSPLDLPLRAPPPGEFPQGEEQSLVLQEMQQTSLLAYLEQLSDPPRN